MLLVKVTSTLATLVLTMLVLLSKVMYISSLYDVVTLPDFVSAALAKACIVLLSSNAEVEVPPKIADNSRKYDLVLSASCSFLPNLSTSYRAYSCPDLSFAMAGG